MWQSDLQHTSACGLLREGSAYYHPCVTYNRIAPRQGFEPHLPDPESGVLPNRRTRNVRYLYRHPARCHWSLGPDGHTTKGTGRFCCVLVALELVEGFALRVLHDGIAGHELPRAGVDTAELLCHFALLNGWVLQVGTARSTRPGAGGSSLGIQDSNL